MAKPERIRFGTIYQRPYGKFQACFWPTKGMKTYLGECDTRGEAELLLAVAKAAWIKQQLIRELGSCGKALALLRALNRVQLYKEEMEEKQGYLRARDRAASDDR